MLNVVLCSLLVQFRLGSAVMSVVPEAAVAVRQLLIHSLDQENTLQRQNHKLEEENQRLREEHQRVAAEYVRGHTHTHTRQVLEKEGQDESATCQHTDLMISRVAVRSSSLEEPR